MQTEKPSERLYRVGADNMRDEDLLAVCVADESKAGYLMADHGGDREAVRTLVDMDARRMTEVGIPRGKAAALAAAFELARRGLKKGLGIRPAIAHPTDVLPLLMDIKDETREHFVAFYLNARNQVIHRAVVAIGSIANAVIHPRELFHPAIERLASTLIVAHNHPSGEVDPSPDDIRLTQRLVEAGKILGIDLLDHIVIGSNDFLSFKERGLI